VDLVAPNAIKAAADGAMLPIIVFAVLFGVALAGVSAERRDAVLRVTQGVADAMQAVGGRDPRAGADRRLRAGSPARVEARLSQQAPVIAYIVLVWR